MNIKDPYKKNNNNHEKESANVFFGMEVFAPWPHQFPRGRIIPESGRHFTLAFLGPIDEIALIQHLGHLPKPKTKIGFAGSLNGIMFLPQKHPHVVAYAAQVSCNESLLLRYQHEMVEWLNMLGFPPMNQDRAWLNHVSIARTPFDEKGWKHDFQRLPFISSKLHLYKSMGGLTYTPKWTYDFMLPFEEISHTADIAFKVRGENFKMLRTHAEIALAFRYPGLFEYFEDYKGLERVEQLIQHLNRAISKADSKEGSPLKSVSFHGEIEQKESFLEWEMIVDV